METWMEIGGQPLTKFGAGCALALLCGLGMCFLRMKPGKGRYGRWIRLCVCVIPMAWFFARLFYALGDWIMIVLEGFFDLNTGRDPLNGFRFWLGGYSLVG